MLQNLDLNIEQLLLDPNNPRFIKDLSNHEHISDENVKELQEETLSKFSNQASTDEEDVTTWHSHCCKGPDRPERTDWSLSTHNTFSPGIVLLEIAGPGVDLLIAITASALRSTLTLNLVPFAGVEWISTL